MIPGISGHVVTACVAAASGAARVETETANLDSLMQNSAADQRFKQITERIRINAKVLREELDACLAILIA